MRDWRDDLDTARLWVREVRRTQSTVYQRERGMVGAVLKQWRDLHWNSLESSAHGNNEEYFSFTFAIDSVSLYHLYLEQTTPSTPTTHYFSLVPWEPRQKMEKQQLEWWPTLSERHALWSKCRRFLRRRGRPDGTDATERWRERRSEIWIHRKQYGWVGSGENGIRGIGADEYICSFQGAHL